MQVYDESRIRRIRVPRLTLLSSGSVRKKKNYLVRYTNLCGVCFFLYAVLGKGFAYAGFSPVFIGEILLLLGLCAAIRPDKLAYLAQKPVGFLLIIFTLWQLSCTLPFLRIYRMDALRDAVLWAYSAFAWIVASLVLRFDNCLGLLIERFRRYAGLLTALALMSFLATSFLSAHLPVWPGTEVSIPFVKPGDMLVHIAGVTSFLMVGLGVRRRWQIPLLLGAFLIGSAINRGGGVACVLAVGLAFVLFPQPRKVMPLIVGVLLLLVLLAGLNIQIKLPKSQRELSSDQLLSNAVSVFGQKERNSNPQLERTKLWRMEWWNRIFQYTFRGPYFWSGKGYGINLTISDGMAVNEREFQGLRSPHNSHLSFLARSGVPGITFWALLQLTWAVLMFSAYFNARLQGRILWARIFAWLLAYWLAFIVNAAFDVSFEGPTAGIPFWMIFGLGWGAYLQYARLPKSVRIPRRTAHPLKVRQQPNALPILSYRSIAGVGTSSGNLVQE